MNRRALALLALTALAGCASAQSSYPSLAVRPGERVSGTMAPAPAVPEAPPPTPTDVIDRLAQLTTQANAAHQEFLSEIAGARGTIAAARNAAVGDEAWARGEIAMARVESARSKTMLALTDLDRLFVDAVNSNAAVERIDAARTQVEHLIAAENAAVDQLGGTGN